LANSVEKVGFGFYVKKVRTVARRAPYLSSVLIIGVGLYVGMHGWIDLNDCVFENSSKNFAN
jgi:ABC-type nickel/cobalt efflux system permease component RcnA